MPPQFTESSFHFSNDEVVPDHIDRYPGREQRDPTKFWLEGFDSFSNESYTIAIDIDDLETAQALHTARMAHLEITQPPASTGTLQDSVYIRHPEQTASTTNDEQISEWVEEFMRVSALGNIATTEATEN